MSNPDTQFTSENAAENGRKGGQKSKRKGLEQQIQDYLKERYTDKDGDERTRLDLIKDALLKFGLKGNVKAIETLLDRGFGKAKQQIDHTGTVQLVKTEFHIDGQIEDVN